MKNKVLIFTVFMVVAIIMITMLTGCDKKMKKEEETPLMNETTKSSYQKITPEKAKEIMDEQSEIVIVDVRTQEEYEDGHIENAVLIPDYEIKEKAEKIIDDKNKKILVYCRSGRRSASAAKILLEMGYTDVLDFGGIIEWPYSIVS